MYNDRCRRRTSELGILGEYQESIFLDERTFGDQLFALGYDVRIAVTGWALLQDGGGALEYDKSVRGALASRLGSLDAAEEYAARLRCRGRWRDWGKYVRA